MRTKAKSEAAPPGEPWSEYEKIEFVRGYSDRVWNNWEQDHPEFQIKLTPAESIKLDQYMMVVDGEEALIEKDKCHKVLDKILKRVKKDYEKWSRENHPEKFVGKKQKHTMDWGAYTKFSSGA